MCKKNLTVVSSKVKGGVKTKGLSLEVTNESGKRRPKGRVTNNSPASERLFRSYFPNEAPEAVTSGTTQATQLENGTTRIQTHVGRLTFPAAPEGGREGQAFWQTLRRYLVPCQALECV